jgi:hypothetical protein
MTYMTKARRVGHGRLVSRTLLVAAVVGVTLLGNLRLQASEVPKATRHVATQRGEASPVLTHAFALSDAATESAAFQTKSNDSADVEAEPVDADSSDDSARLVPAIYAWDPDVRFVYFRHISKWM